MKNTKKTHTQQNSSLLNESTGFSGLVQKKSFKSNHFTEEEKWRVLHSVGGLLIANKWTFESIVGSQGIDVRTFRRWLIKTPEMSDAFNKYKEQLKEVHKKELKTKAEKGLMVLLTERTVTTKRTVVDINADGTVTPKRIITIESVIPPNPAAVFFALTNIDPENWRHVQYHEAKVMAGTVNKNIENMTDKQLDAEIARLSEALGLSVPQNSLE